MSALMKSMFEKLHRQKWELNPLMIGTPESKEAPPYGSVGYIALETDIINPSNDVTTTNTEMLSYDSSAMGMGMDMDMDMDMGGGTFIGQNSTASGSQQTQHGVMEISTAEEDEQIMELIDFGAHIDEDSPSSPSSPSSTTAYPDQDADSEFLSRISSITSSTQNTPTSDTPSTTTTRSDFDLSIDPAFWGDGMDIDTDPIVFDAAASPEPWDAHPDSSSSSSSSSSSDSSSYSSSPPQVAFGSLPPKQRKQPVNIIKPMPHITKRLIEVQKRNAQNGPSFFQSRVYKRSPLSRESVFVPDGERNRIIELWVVRDGKGVLGDIHPADGFPEEMCRICEKCRGRCRWKGMGVNTESVCENEEEGKDVKEVEEELEDTDKELSDFRYLEVFGLEEPEEKDREI